MSTIALRKLRIGLRLALAVALLAFAARLASAQQAPIRLSLGDAVRLASNQSALVHSAQVRAGEAQARVTQARSALLPQVSADASDMQRSFNTASFGLTLPGFDPNGQVIGGVKTVDARGRIAASLLDLAAIDRVRAAQSAVGAASVEVQGAAENAASQAAAAYVRALRADAQLNARLADSSLAADLLQIAQDQLKAGVGVALDVTRAQSQLAAVRAQLIAARNDRDRAQLDLRRVLVLPLDAPIVLTDSLDITSTASADEAAAVTQAIAQRADIRALDAQIVAARRQVTATKAERIPTLGVFGDHGVNGKSVDHLLPTYDFGIQLSVPIFDGFRREGRIEEQSLVVKDLEFRRKDLAQQVEVDVRGAMLDLASARQQVDAAREHERLAEQEVAQAQERFRAGVAGNADVITASLSLDQARTQLVDALTGLRSSQIALARASGLATQIQ